MDYPCRNGTSHRFKALLRIELTCSSIITLPLMWESLPRGITLLPGWILLASVKQRPILGKQNEALGAAESVTTAATAWP